MTDMPMTAEDLLMPPKPALTANDRCDRDGAQAYTKWVLEESQLLFCVHHDREHEEILQAQGFVRYIDERDRLLTEASDGVA